MMDETGIRIVVPVVDESGLNAQLVEHFGRISYFAVVESRDLVSGSAALGEGQCKKDEIEDVPGMRDIVSAC